MTLPRFALGRSKRSLSARDVSLFVTIAGVATIGAALSNKPIMLLWNASPSVPIGLYRVVPDTLPHIGDLIVVHPTPAIARFMANRRYVAANVPLVKPVAASYGTRICRSGLELTIGGQHVATALGADRFGRPLPRWTGCHRLGRNQLFLIAPTSPASFDSRYFGPIDRAQVIGRAIPLWIWS